MEVELYRLDLRYESLRICTPARDRKLVGSISEVGQLTPIALACAQEDADRLVVIDGYRRVRALRRLGRDVVWATCWDLPEIDALLLGRSLRTESAETPLEQGWLLEALRTRFGMENEELARRFDKSPSWVSRRLGLVRELPAPVQELIRQGQIVAHAAGKYLVPMARANRDHCTRLARAIAPAALSTREVSEIYAGWRDAPLAGREAIVGDPVLFLRARRALAEENQIDAGPREGLLKDVATIAAVSRRAVRRLREGASGSLSHRDRDEIRCALRLAGTEIERLIERIEEEEGGDDDRPGDTHGDPETGREGAVDSRNRTRPEDLSGCGPGGAPIEVG